MTLAFLDKLKQARAWLYLGTFAALVLLGAYGLGLTNLLVLSKIEVEGPLIHLSTKSVQEKALRTLSGNFLTVNLQNMQSSLRNLPWVRQVEIRRVWPGTLRIKIEEHKVLARWATNGLVNTYGERFLANLSKTDEELPIFMGPAQYTANISQQFLLFKTQLARLELVPVDILLTPRYGWRLRLDNGLVVELGRNDMGPRLQKFVQAAIDSGIPVDTMAYADLRYANGFAVRFAKG